MHQLELGDSGDQDRMDGSRLVQPCHEFGHHLGHLRRMGRRVDDLARGRICHIVLHPSILARLRRTAPNTFDQSAMDFADQSFGHRQSASKILGNQLERLAIVQQFAYVVGVGVGHFLTGQQPFSLFQRQSRALDVRGVVRFQHKRPCACLTHPLFGERCRLQETPGPLDPRQSRRHGVGNVEAWLKTHVAIFSSRRTRNNKSPPIQRGLFRRLWSSMTIVVAGRRVMQLRLGIEEESSMFDVDCVPFPEPRRLRLREERRHPRPFSSWPP